MQGDGPTENENQGEGEEDRPTENDDEEEEEEDAGEEENGGVDSDAAREVSQSSQRNSRPRSKLIFFVAHKLQDVSLK